MGGGGRADWGVQGLEGQRQGPGVCTRITVPVSNTKDQPSGYKLVVGDLPEGITAQSVIASVTL